MPGGQTGLGTLGGHELGFWHKLRLRSRSNLYFALAFLPRHQREAFRDVYRFLRSADDVVDEAGAAERPAAARALASFSDELSRIYAGAATSAAAVVPEAARLAAVIRRFGLPRRHFDAILAGIARDLDERATPHADWAALAAYCEAIGSSLGHLSLALFTDGDPAVMDDPAAATYAHDLGLALQLANILRDVGEDAARGRIYLPLEDLARFEVSVDSLLQRRMTPAFARLAAHEHGRIMDLIASARAALATRPALRRRLVVAEIWADVYLAQLDALAARGWDVFAPGPTLRKRRKLALAVSRWVRTRLGLGLGPADGPGHGQASAGAGAGAGATTPPIASHRA